MAIIGFQSVFVLVGLLSIAATAHAEMRWEKNQSRQDQTSDRRISKNAGIITHTASSTLH